MNRFYLYHGSFGIFGAVMVLNAILSATANGLGVGNILMVLGGSGVGLAAIYALLTMEPAEVTIDRYHLGLVVLGTLLIIVGTALQLLADGP